MIIDDLLVMFAKKLFKKSVNIIHKKMSFFVFRQSRIISYFKSIDSSKIKSFKFNVLISSFNSTSIKFVSINYIARISHCHMFASNLFLHRFSHICRFCHETFAFNNDLHRHLRLIHLIFKSNRSLKDSVLHDRKKFQIKFFVFREQALYH